MAAVAVAERIDKYQTADVSVMLTSIPVTTLWGGKVKLAKSSENKLYVRYFHLGNAQSKPHYNI